MAESDIDGALTGSV
ncbi:hypothetical protein CGLO_02833 [Colletotrichum gloeosporioides Cg-14]|uniref:Uncharacterized protein n=1 Tax=Colletotrichum gloeosporioides (strain Cg-14) TaxID=1237896 RepID=T0KY05_COLGC|nr:hypothetical protein CGLO_02833 [Colletotrichum gloeosporioides Cg-14]